MRLAFPSFLSSVGCGGLALLAAAGGPAAAGVGEWQRFDDPAPVVGADGQLHEPSCSNYPGTDPTFRFWVRPGRSSNLMVYFEGGGACWDNLTCSLTSSFNPAVGPGDGPEGAGGVFDDTRRDNPVRDWTVVDVPLCTGDIHTGAADRPYRTCWAFPRCRRGSRSATAASTISWSCRTGSTAACRRRASCSSPASAPAATARRPTSRGWRRRFRTPGRGSWNQQLAPFVFGDDPLAVPGPELLRVAAQAYPRGRFAQYTTDRDGVQVSFYNIMKSRYGPGDGSCDNPEADWNRPMLATLDRYRQTLPNFRSFVASGASHTILRGDAFYDDVGAGQSVSAWLGSQVRPRPRTAPWVDAACPGCLTPLPCP